MDKHLFQRQFRSDLTAQSKNTLAGSLWLLLEPVLVLIVYSLVFGFIFTARIAAEDERSFVVYLAVVLWPWFAFSQALQKSLNVLDENMSLLKKMVIDKHALVAARVCSVFALQIIAYSLVLLVLRLSTGELVFSHIWLVALSLLQLFIAALGLSYLLSALGVFIRDIKIAVPMLIMLLFFSAPIIWTMEMIPTAYRHYFYYNPLTHVAISIRDALLLGESSISSGWWWNWLLALLLFWFGWWVFTRLAPWFEEYA